MALKEHKEHLANKKHDAVESKQQDPEDQQGRQIVHEPPLTVDQLSAYRKRKPAFALPTDNLFWPDGSLKNLTSEYQRCFKKLNLVPITFKKAKQDTLKLEGQHEFQSEYKNCFVQIPDSLYRPQLIRRCTNLRLEGNYFHSTDYRENFTAYVLQKKVQLERKATTLKLLGQMNLETENRRNFVLYQNVFRPPLCKKLTNLHLSGSLHMDTENRDKFLGYKVERQHPLTKMPTNLHLEGTLFLQPEYKSAFVEYKNFEKPKPLLPVNNLRSPVDFIADSDSSENIKHPFIPHLRSYLDPHIDVPRRSSYRSMSRPSSRPASRNLERFIDEELDHRFGTEKKGKRVYGTPPTIIVRSSEPKISTPKSAERKPSYWGSKTRTHSVSPRITPTSYFGKEEKPKPLAKSLPSLHRGHWKPKTRVAGPGETRQIKPTSPEYLGRFECQPEYRKAYINYLIRERVHDRSPSPLDKQLQKGDPDREETVNALSAPNRPLRTRKSSPNLSIGSAKSIEAIETAAFGRRCRNRSVSEMSSSDDFSSKSKKSQIPRPTRTLSRTKIADHYNNTDSEPAFVVMQ